MPEAEPRPFFHAVETVDGVAVVRLDYPHLDTECREALYDLVERQGVRRLVLDFSKVVTVSSSALGVLVSLNRRLGAVGGHLALAGLNESIAYLLSVTTLDRILTIRPDAASAVAALRP